MVRQKRETKDSLKETAVEYLNETAKKEKLEMVSNRVDREMEMIDLPRTYEEILEAWNEAGEKQWYIDFLVYRQAIESKEVKVVQKETSSGNRTTILQDKWEDKIKSAQFLECKYGKDNLPQSRIDCGMLLGKFILLSWVIGRIDIYHDEIADKIVKSPDEIAAKRDENIDKIWLHRHHSRKCRIEAGEDCCDNKLWREAEKAAKEMQKKYGIDNFLPYSDFDLGMKSGLLSASRWILGSEWDCIDA